MQRVRYLSIGQFRNIVKRVRDRAKYHNLPLPILRFNGSVKLHGTSSSIIKDPRTGEIWCQSRERIITPEKDNAGFARFISELPGRGIDIYFNIAAGIYGMNNIKPGDLIGIYGEWCGQGIQNGVAISQLSTKRFVVFGIKIYTPNADGKGGISSWFSPRQLESTQDLYARETDQISENKNSIYSIQKFQHWTIDIDFAHPELIQNQLIEFTNEVEKMCPVGKAFGVEGHGEGVVYRCISKYDFETSDLIFKVQGEAHSVTKVKKLASVDIEMVSKLNDLIKMIMTENRLQQMFDSMFDKTGLDPTNPKNLGQFIKICVEDVLKEETDTIIGNGFDIKEFTKAVPVTIKQWFFSQDV